MTEDHLGFSWLENIIYFEVFVGRIGYNSIVLCHTTLWRPNESLNYLPILLLPILKVYSFESMLTKISMWQMIPNFWTAVSEKNLIFIGRLCRAFLHGSLAQLSWHSTGSPSLSSSPAIQRLHEQSICNGCFGQLDTTRTTHTKASNDLRLKMENSKMNKQKRVLLFEEDMLLLVHVVHILVFVRLTQMLSFYILWPGHFNRLTRLILCNLSIIIN